MQGLVESPLGPGGYASFHPQQQATNAHLHEAAGGPSPSQGARQLKPLQTGPDTLFQNPGFYAPHGGGGGGSGSGGEPRQSVGVEMESPGGSVATGPSPLMAAAAGYGTAQSPLGHSSQLAGGGMATPVSAGVGGGGGLQMGGGVVTTYPPRRKAIRAAQACDACRARKAKCDEGRPSCGFCKESQVLCVYREVPPPKYVTRGVLIS